MESTMADSYNTEYNARLKNAIKNDADFAAGRKAALLATVGMVSTRVLLFVTGMFYAYVYELQISTQEVVALCVSVVFGRLIYNGVRALAVLTLIGGFLSILLAWQNESIISIFNCEDSLEIAYGVSFIIAIIMTIVPMTYLLFNSKYRKYVDEIYKIKQEILTKLKNEKPR
jgi:hypothetical protein